MKKVRYVYLFLLGKYYDSPNVVRTFSSMDKALDAVPQTFREKTSMSTDSLYYAEDNRTKKWLKIVKKNLE